MTTIGERLAGKMNGGIISIPVFAAAGALAGYVYGKLANLPAHAAARAYAIGAVAECVLSNLADVLVENRTHRLLLKATLLTLSHLFAIHQLREKGLMGDKMLYLAIAYSALSTLGLLAFIYAPTEEVKKI